MKTRFLGSFLADNITRKVISKADSQVRFDSIGLDEDREFISLSRVIRRMYLMEMMFLLPYPSFIDGN